MTDSNLTKQKIKKNFVTAIVESQILLAHAAREGLEVDDETIKVLVDASRCDDWPLENEEKFWIAFRKLSKTVKPVTVDSLKSIKKPFKEESPFFPKILKNRLPQSVATRTVKFYKIFIVTTVIILLGIQIYWLVGSSIRSNILTLQKELETFGKSENMNDKSASKNARIMKIGAQLEAGFDMLRNWDNTWRKITFSNLHPKYDDKSSNEHIKSRDKILETSFFALKILQEYFLPLLYGLLGSLIFVIKALAAEIKKLTFTNESRINYGMRVFLGMLTGFAVTWFLANPDSATNLNIKNLSPLALSFLAGYSVDLLFSAMDNIINAFTGKKDEKMSKGAAMQSN